MTKTEQTLVSVVVLICAALYYPVLSGLPIWDDTPVWFYDFSLGHTYSHIFKNYTWPFTVAFQKFLFTQWGHRYSVYHAVNISIHLLNAILLYNILSDLKIRGRVAIGLLFLFHPANVITVSWMIQLKTLLSFFFAAVSVRLLILYQKNYFAWAGAGLSFVISVLSKSGSLVLPALIVFRPDKWDRKFIITATVAGLIGFLGALKILTSPELQGPSSALGYFNIQVILRTTSYYFWQAFFPVNTIPVKDLNLESGLWFDLATLGLIIFCIYHFRKSIAGKALLAAQIFLLPFYGIIPAPYMGHSLVGDQHLYLVLPLYLIFVMNLPVKREAIRVFLVVLILPFFGYKVRKSLAYYENDPIFYKSIMEEYPGCLAIGMNLGFYYTSHNEIQKAKDLIAYMDKNIEKNPRVKENPFHPIYVTYRDIVTQMKSEKKDIELFRKDKEQKF